MVGLEGCKRFCSELEKLAGKLEKKTVNATPEIIEAFAKAVKTMQSYLQDLLNGSPDVPLRLYSALNPIVLAQAGWRFSPILAIARLKASLAKN